VVQAGGGKISFEDMLGKI